MSSSFWIIFLFDFVILFTLWFAIMVMDLNTYSNSIIEAQKKLCVWIAYYPLTLWRKIRLSRLDALYYTQGDKVRITNIIMALKSPWHNKFIYVPVPWREHPRNIQEAIDKKYEITIAGISEDVGRPDFYELEWENENGTIDCTTVIEEEIRPAEVKDWKKYLGD